MISSAQHSINCNGADVYGTSGAMSYTVGQTDYTFIQSATGKAGHGVQQPIEIFSNDAKITLSCLLYPNPAAIEIKFQSDDPAYAIFDYSLYDVQGRLLMQESGINMDKPIPLEKLTTGTYVMYVTNSRKDELTCKFIKITP